MTRYAPFRKLLRVLVAWSVAYGGVAAFTAAFLKVQIGMSDGYILLLSSAAYLGGVSSLWLLESRFDRVGSKPVLNVAVLAWMGVLLGWLLVAGGVLPASLGIVLVLQFLMGLLAALVNLANNKLAMGVVPAMGRNHFFAIYSVVANVTLGLSPIVWGLLIDVIGDAPRSGWACGGIATRSFSAGRPWRSASCSPSCSDSTSRKPRAWNPCCGKS